MSSCLISGVMIVAGVMLFLVLAVLVLMIGALLGFGYASGLL
jgi:hypothetical protein